MRNYFTSQGLLDDGMQMAGLSTIGRYDQEQDPLRKFQEFVPRDENELVSMQRTMIPTGNQSNDGTPTFITPEGAQYQQNIGLMQEVQTKAMSDFQKKVQNPFFKIGDFAADAIRNTIGMPGGGLKADPSATAKSELQMKLQGLDMAAQQNATNLITAREARDKALSEVFKDSTDNLSPIQNPSAKDFTPDSLALYQKSGSANDLVRRDDMRMTEIGGMSYTFNKNDPVGTLRMTIPLEERARNEKIIRDWKTLQIKEEQYAKDREKFRNNLSKNENTLKTAKLNKEELTNNIKELIAILDANPKAAGLGSLLRNLPETEANLVNEYLATIRANVAFDSLQSMRNNSPTGGALGNVSNVELELLYKNLAPLDQKMSAQKLKKSLQKIIRVNEETLEIMANAYNKDIERYKYETYEEMNKNDKFQDYIFNQSIFETGTDMQTVDDANAKSDADKKAELAASWQELFRDEDL